MVPHERFSAFVQALGVVTPAGLGLDALLQRIDSGQPCLSEAERFELPPERRTLVGALPDGLLSESGLPRSHRIALAALGDLAGDPNNPPDAVVLGITTGGMSATEAALRRGETHKAAYAHHGLHTVTRVVAEAVGCTGLLLTLSTACSSGAVALAVGRELLRAGLARRVLAGGVDSLCQLTVQGFSLLRVCDPRGCRPLDADRAGMTVAEGAAFLLLDAEPSPTFGRVALVGSGLSCDAHHATSPDPSGEGAAQAMRLALEDAGLDPGSVSYLNLHGTGTRENDIAEARALRLVFGDSPPPLSSTKGAVGHALAASGAIEAALSVSALRSGRLPPNIGLVRADPELGLEPLRAPATTDVTVVQSNSLGFGGNNASLVLQAHAERTQASVKAPVLWILATGAVTGAGTLGATWERLCQGGELPARLPDSALAGILSGIPLRRLGRLAQLALAATTDAAPSPIPVGAVFYGTGWGALQDTHTFLDRLWTSGGAFSSPTGFSASVHNAVSGQLAMHWGARGANITVVDPGNAVAQAALVASLVDTASPCWLVAADEWHPVFSPLLAGTSEHGTPVSREADGAAALLVSRTKAPQALACLRVVALGGVSLGAGAPGDRDRQEHDAVLDASPEGATRPEEHLLPRVPLCRILGTHASLAGLGLALAVKALAEGLLPAGLTGSDPLLLPRRGILVQGQGFTLSVRSP